MDCKQELLKRLDSLAEKLGTTGSHLWAVLVRQGVITGYADLGVGALLAVVAIVLLLLGRAVWKKNTGLDDTGDSNGYAFLAWGAMALATVIAVGQFYDALLELGNPEFFALTKIMETLGK